MFTFTAKAPPRAHTPPEVLVFAQRIQAIHGAVRVCHEASGWHIYCASPICLERHGAIELVKKHLAINADKYLGLGKYANQRGTRNQDNVSRCMKTSTSYRVSDLLKMPPIDQRGFSKYDHGTVTVTDTRNSLVEDEKGNLIPDVPGDTVPLSSLPADHPARIYLAQRQYRIEDLEQQFSAAFCTKEAPESSDKGRFYKRFAGGFRDTPQNRIILFGYAMGVRKIWQARYIELADATHRYILHPYSNELVAVSQRGEGGRWQPMPGYTKDVFDPAKYKTAFGGKRNETVMGFDAAVAWNEVRGRSRQNSVVAITEGPLDAARLFPYGPAVAVLGKHMSHNQAALLCSKFGKFVLVGQNDDASQLEAMPKWVFALNEFNPEIKHSPVPTDVKDVGELSPERAGELFQPFLQ